MDHFHGRLDSAGQSAWALAGLNGVFVALISPLVDDFTGVAQILGLLAVGAATLAVFVIFHGARPRSVASINVESYRRLWKAHLSPNTHAVPGYDPKNPAAAIVEELLQFHDKDSPLVEIMQLTEDRYDAIKRALAMTGLGAALLVAAVTTSIIT